MTKRTTWNRSTTNETLGKAISQAFRMLEAISKLTSTTSMRLDNGIRFNTLMMSSLRVPRIIAINFCARPVRSLELTKV